MHSSPAQVSNDLQELGKGGVPQQSTAIRDVYTRGETKASPPGLPRPPKIPQHRGRRKSVPSVASVAEVEEGDQEEEDKPPDFGIPSTFCDLCVSFVKPHEPLRNISD